MKKRLLFLSMFLLLLFAWQAEAKELTHRVAKGESLYAISRKAGITVKQLKQFNGLKGNTIQPGMLLRLQEKEVAARPEQKGKSQATCAPEETVAHDLGAPAGKSLLPLPNGELEAVAMAFLATPYQFGSENRSATDCSGFTQQVFRQLGLDLPRTAREQFQRGEKVAAGSWQRGDLLFFRTYANYPSHVGIYLQEGKMIHASRSKRQVVVSDIDLPYFRKRYLGARRVASFDPIGNLLEGLMDRADEINEEGLFEADVQEAEIREPKSAAPLAAIPESPQLRNGPPAGS